MSKVTELATGQINGSDRLLIELIEPTGGKPFIAVNWPTAATVCTPAQLDAVVAVAMRIFANSVVTLACIRVQRKL